MIFRGLISRALFNVDDAEYAAMEATIKAKLVKAKRLSPTERPTQKQVVKHCRTMIPDAVTLRENVDAVIQYCLVEDAAVDAKISLRAKDDRSPLPKPFFKARS